MNWEEVVPATVQSLEAIDDLQRLNRLIRQAPHVNSVEELRLAE